MKDGTVDALNGGATNRNLFENTCFTGVKRESSAVASARQGELRHGLCRGQAGTDALRSHDANGQSSHQGKALAITHVGFGLPP